MKAKNRIYQLTCMMIIVFTMIQCNSNKLPQLGKDPVKDVIAAMTLEEKAFFVTGTGMNIPGLTLPGDTTPTPGAPVVGETQKLVPGAAGTTYEIKRLGIPAMVVADGPAGLRISPRRENDSATYYCTAFPVATLLASSWDTALLSRVGRAMGNEVLEYGADVILGPGMNIHRNPLCGRNFEYYSEDPYLTGKMAASMVKGVESQGVGTSIKHFAANNAETNRMALNTIVSERALREIYLEGFRIAVQDAQPWTVMSSYNLINGTMASESPDLLTKVLRDDWGFKGMVMTDWFGGINPVAQMQAGNDLLMPGTPQQAKAIIKAVQEGKLDVAVLDRNVERILNIILETPRFKNYKFSNKPDLKDHANITRQAATEGMILLKNSNKALPIPASDKNIAAFGNTSYDIITGGTGSGDVNEAYSVSLTDGLKGAGYILNQELTDIYDAYIKDAKLKRPALMPFMPQVPLGEMKVTPQLAAKMASTADIALITIGRNSGEMLDRKVEDDFNLTSVEKDMISTVAKAFQSKGKKAVVILNIAGVIEVSSWKDIPDAILLAWQAGQETGNSITDVLSGKVNPSGKLTSTFPVSYQDVPSAKNFPGEILETGATEKPSDESGIASLMRPKPSKIVYEEGLYVGYRYYETFKVKPVYEFGYGLSYTTFAYSNLKLSSDKFNGKITATVDITNSGKVYGKEVVQLYLSAPANKLDKPAIELKGFAKTKLLAPGESQSVSFDLDARQLASFDQERSSWIAEAGDYTVKIGASSRDIKQSAIFNLAADSIVKKESVALVPSETINERKASK
jgi:beta-glucosidase